jgi:hypothetical protein
MPYDGEFANKSSHMNLIKNPDVQDFLSRCKIMSPINGEECDEIIKRFITPSVPKGVSLPEFIIAVDGSNYESSVAQAIPSTKIGYVKIGSLLIELNKYKKLNMNGRFVDPFEVAKLQENNSSISFTLPSSNVILDGYKSVKDSFRAQLNKLLNNFRINADDPKTSLKSTLFYLATLRPNEKEEFANDQEPYLLVHQCPNDECSERDIKLTDCEEQYYCKCGEPIYPSDCLRIWEEVNEYQSNGVALSRTMQVLEHLIPIHYIRCLEQQGSLDVLSTTAFILDGALAIFGPPAWLHASILKYIHQTNAKLINNGFEPLFVMSLIKSGEVAEFVKMINPHIESNKVFALDDDFRYKYVSPGRKIPKNGHGYETYYGQDFIYKTPSGRVFVFNLVYPFENKSTPDVNTFKIEKSNIVHYKIALAKALEIINEFECDLYENSVVPIALAHRYTAISLKPGGKVLDLLTKKSLINNK